MNKANILVVDDELIERQTLTDILRLEGYHVAAVANGEAAVDYVRLNPVDLIILDLRMPGMSGLDVVKVVNRISPDIEIILLTAHGSIESAIDALRSQVHDYLLKPASPVQIIDSVVRGLARRDAKLRHASTSKLMSVQTKMRLLLWEMVRLSIMVAGLFVPKQKPSS